MKDKKYLIILLLVFAVYVIYDLNKSDPENWMVTFNDEDKNPFGTKATRGLLNEIRGGEEVNNAFLTVYEMVNEQNSEDNLLILSQVLQMDRNDVNALLELKESGRTILLGASDFKGSLGDSLDFNTSTNLPELFMSFAEIEEELAQDTPEEITLTLDGESRSYSFPKPTATTYFDKLNLDNWEVQATNGIGEAVLIRYRHGKGNLYLTMLPLAFTNYLVLNENTSEFSASLLGFFPTNEPLTHNQYYQLGRVAPQTELRVLLANSSMRVAVYLGVLIVLMILLVQTRRKQALIPIVKPPSNLSLEFVSTLGRLYYKQNDHLNLALKRIAFWKDYVHQRYHLRTERLSEKFSSELAKKSGIDIKTVQALVLIVKSAEAQEAFSEPMMAALEKYLNEFYRIN